MPRKRHKPEEIVAKLRQVDVLVSQGQSVADAVRSIGVTEVTYYRWRQEFGGLKADQVRRLKALEAENGRLRRAVAELTLDKQILKEAASGNYCRGAYRRFRHGRGCKGEAPHLAWTKARPVQRRAESSERVCALAFTS